MKRRYIIAACKRSESANDPHFPVSVAWFDVEETNNVGTERVAALRQAREFFDGEGLKANHLRIVDGPAYAFVRDDREVVYE